ncbi:hypothetical protein B5S29_g4039 [[Candida] boidinii]|nr:hypothetical protein B5S29_g4039 [[Candida] boidinii]
MSEGFYINEKKNWKNNKILTSLNDLSFLRIRSEIEDENNKKFHDYIESFLPNWIIFEKAIVYFYDHLSFFYDFIELKYLEQVFKTRFKKDELTGKTLIIDPEKANYSEIALVLSIYYLVRRILSENDIGINDENNDIKEGDSKETKNNDDVEKMYENNSMIQLILFLSGVSVTGLSAMLIVIQIRSVDKDGVEPSEDIDGADLVGKAVSTAYSIGLHIDPDLILDIFFQKSPISKKTWRLLWQHIRFLDVRYSSALGNLNFVKNVLD